MSSEFIHFILQIFIFYLFCLYKFNSDRHQRLKSATEQETLPALVDSVQTLQPQVDNFTRAVQGNLDRIDEKIADPSKVVELEDLTPMLLDLAYALTKMNDEIQKNNDLYEKLGDTQEQCIKDVWGLIAYRMQGEVETYHLALDANTKATRDLKDRKSVV